MTYLFQVFSSIIYNEFNQCLSSIINLIFAGYFKYLYCQIADILIKLFQLMKYKSSRCTHYFVGTITLHSSQYFNNQSLRAAAAQVCRSIEWLQTYAVNILQLHLVWLCFESAILHFCGLYKLPSKYEIYSIFVIRNIFRDIYRCL